MLLSCGKGDILSWYIEYKDKSKNDNRIAEIDYTFHFNFFEDISRFFVLTSNFRWDVKLRTIWCTSFDWYPNKQFFTYFVILQKLFSEASFSLSHNIHHFFYYFQSLCLWPSIRKNIHTKLKSNTFDFPSLLLSIDFFSFVTFFSSSFSCCTEAARHGTHVMHLDRIAC